VRELLAYGTVLGVQLLSVRLMPMAQYSFGGFLVIAVISAVWNMCVNIYHNRLEMEVGTNE